MYLPEKDRSYVTKGEMFEDIVSSLGGRVAEQLILEDISTGASNDLQQATNIARQMITKYGLSLIHISHLQNMRYPGGDRGAA